MIDRNNVEKKKKEMNYFKLIFYSIKIYKINLQ